MEERNCKLFSGKRVLVTGGTGSFGHQIVDRLLDEDPAEIRIFSRDEDKQVRMSEEYGMGHHYPRKASLNFVIGDVRNRQSVRQAIRGTDIVFHADIAEVMVEALSPKKGVPVQTVGIQPGEKIHEVPVSEAEAVRTIEDECTYIILPQIDLEAARSFYGQRSQVAFSEFTSDAARRLSKPEIRSLLLRTGWPAS